MNTLTIRFIEFTNGHLWLDLSTDAEKRQCCYTLQNGTWIYETGEDEPAMSAKLQASWENGRGDELITACLETERTQFLHA